MRNSLSLKPTPPPISSNQPSAVPKKIAITLSPAIPNFSPSTLTELIAQDLIANHPNGKLVYGLSVYSTKTTGRPLQTLVDQITPSVKALLKANQRSARFIVGNGAPLPTVAVSGQGLLTHGGEYLLLESETGIMLAKTIAIQDVDSWAKRDLGRPRRNAKQGMLPPKLARLLLNLAGPITANTIVLDPFCGSGTVLMEAGLMGANTVFASDINPTAVKDTISNLSWLQAEFGHGLPENFRLQAAISPAEKLSGTKPDWLGVVDYLVTETTLGAPKQGQETATAIQIELKSLETLYREAFLNLRPLLKPTAVIVIAAPEHIIDNRSFTLPVDLLLHPLGYRSLLPNGPLIYHRPQQKVGRSIWIFKLADALND